jgi:hypothetical protein
MTSLSNRSRHRLAVVIGSTTTSTGVTTPSSLLALLYSTPGSSIHILDIKVSQLCKEPIPKIRNKYSQKRNCAGPQSQFPHSWVCERFIYSDDRSAYSAAGNMWTDPGNTYINLSQTHEGENWDWGRAIPRKVIHKCDFLCSVEDIIPSVRFKGWRHQTQSHPWNLISEEDICCGGLASMLPQPAAQNMMKMEQWSPTIISWNKLDLGLARVLLILWHCRGPILCAYSYTTYPCKTCYFIQHCFICRPSDFAVSVDDGMNPGQLRFVIGCQTTRPDLIHILLKDGVIHYFRSNINFSLSRNSFFLYLRVNFVLLSCTRRPCDII